MTSEEAGKSPVLHEDERLKTERAKGPGWLAWPELVASGWRVALQD